MQTGVYLVSGIPGAGKTTVSRLLAARFNRGAHVEGDVVGDMVISGKVLPAATPEQSNAESKRQLLLRRQNLAMLADSFFASGFVPVIDDVIVSGDVLDHYRAQVRSRPLIFVMLLPRLEVVQQRDAAREKHFFEVWKHLDDQVRNVMPRVGLWLDSSELTAAQTVDLILSRANDGIVGD